MDEGFIIMQIGNAELDAVCDEAIVPAITEAGLVVRRVDRHNAGDLLKSEIVQFIERSQIIVADVTNERPNCYLEIGYAMGLGKKANLILTAREDHHHSSPNFRHDGPKVHFDLEGYDLLLWRDDDLPRFKAELQQRIERRIAIVRRPLDRPQQVAPAEGEWRDELRAKAETGLNEAELSAYMEVTAEIRPAVSSTQRELLDAMREANVHTFGWPIGAVLDGGDSDGRPRPTADGVLTEIRPTDWRRTYDFWKVFSDGRFYTLISLFEDDRRPDGDTVYSDVRTTRITEALMLLMRLYRRLDASDTDEITVRIRHAGLAGRTLRAADPMRVFFSGAESGEDVVETAVTASLIELESNVVEHVRKFTAPLFLMFNFTEISDGVVDQIANDFVAGKIG
jgi:hypothetical protein